MAQPDYQLTSVAVSASQTGDYKLHEKALLIPHEGLRRELFRGANALKSFDLIAHPWKIHCFNTWYKDFFLPSIHEHHDLEEKIFFPFYVKLGCETPSKQCEDHKDLLNRLSNITKLSADLLALILEKEKLTDNTPTIQKLTEDLQSEFRELVVKTVEHLTEEETFWPAVLEKHGDKKCKEVEDLIVNHGIKHGGQDFENFGCAIADSMGIKSISPSGNPYGPALEAAGVNVNDYHQWANKTVQDEFLFAFPYPVRAWLLPGWNKRYMRFKAMILSCQCDTDIVHVQDQVAEAGCQCVIA